MGHLTFTSTAPSGRCNFHHRPEVDCIHSSDLADTLRDLHLAGVPVTPTSPQLLDLCDAFLDGECTEQAEVLIATATPHGEMRTRHQSCPDCLWFAVSADLRSGRRVEVLVPAHAIEVA